MGSSVGPRLPFNRDGRGVIGRRFSRSLRDELLLDRGDDATPSIVIQYGNSGSEPLLDANSSPNRSSVATRGSSMSPYG